MFRIVNIEQVNSTIDKWLATVDEMAVEFCKGFSIQVFAGVVQHSVQYSGDFAANWKYELNTITPKFQAGAASSEYEKTKLLWTHGKDKRPFKEVFQGIDGFGDTTVAQAYAFRANRGADEGFKLGDTIFIHNSAVHDEPYAVGIESGTVSKRGPHPLQDAKDAALRVTGRVSGWDAFKRISRWQSLDSIRRRPLASRVSAW